MNFQISPQKIVPVSFSTSSISEFPFSYIFSKYCIISVFLIFAKSKPLYFVWVCSTLIIGETEIFLVYLLASCISLDYLFIYQVSFSNLFFSYWFEGDIYILCYFCQLKFFLFLYGILGFVFLEKPSSYL